MLRGFLASGLVYAVYLKFYATETWDSSYTLLAVLQQSNLLCCRIYKLKIPNTASSKITTDDALHRLYELFLEILQLLHYTILLEYKT